MSQVSMLVDRKTWRFNSRIMTTFLLPTASMSKRNQSIVL